MNPILLDRNENRYGPAPECLAALRTTPAESLFNYTRDFQRGFFSPLSRRLADLHAVPEKRVILGYGCEDLLKQAIHHWVQPGEPLLVPSASWWYYRALADEVGGVMVEYPIVETPTTFVYDVDALARIQRETRARVILIASPSNPTGNSFPAERLEEVIEIFRDGVVVYDEAYYGFSEPPGEGATALARKFPNLLVLRTFSKLYALAGARIGYGVAGEGLGDFLKFTSRNLGYSRISERLALAALSNPGYYEGIRNAMLADRRRIIDALRSQPGVRAFDSDANFVFARFPPEVAGTLKAELDRRGLIIKFLTESNFAHCARITIGTSDETSALVDALQEILSSLPAHR
jgi:histidinol-phosphate aminotransferase